MNLLLSIFLSLAMILGGTGSLPAEPDVATTWTLRNVTLDTGAEQRSLDPELRLTAAAGSDQVDLHLEVESGGRTLAPMSLEIAEDALRASFGTEDSVYSLSAQELEALSGIEANVPPMLDAFSELFTSAGALLGDAAGGRPAALHAGLALALAAFKTCGASVQPAQLELDGVPLEGQRIALTLNPESAAALADALRECGAPELEGLMNAALDAINLTGETSYASYAEAIARLAPGREPALNLEITAAHGDGTGRCRIKCGMRDQSAGDLLARVDCITRADRTDVDAYLYLGDLLSGFGGTFLDLDAQFTPAGAARANLDVTFVDRYAPFPFPRSDKLRLTADCANTGGLRDIRLAAALQYGYSGSASADLRLSERREEDGSTTAATSLSVDANGSHLGGLRFDLNIAGDAPRPLFEGTEPCPLTAGALLFFHDSDIASIRPALGADVMKLGIDLSSLIEDPSVRALLAAFE